MGLYLKNEVPKYESGQHPQYGTSRVPELAEGDVVFKIKAGGTGSIHYPHSPPKTYSKSKVSQYVSLSLSLLSIAGAYYFYGEANDAYEGYKGEWDKKRADQLKEEVKRDDTYALVSLVGAGLGLASFFYFTFKGGNLEKKLNLTDASRNKYLTKIEQKGQEVRLSFGLRF